MYEPMSFEILFVKPTSDWIHGYVSCVRNIISYANSKCGVCKSVYPYVWLSYSIEPGKRLAEDAEWKLLIKCEHCGRSVIQKGHQLPLVTGRAIKEFAELPPKEDKI